MKYLALLFAALLATTSLGCQTMGHGGLLGGCGCSDCTGGAGCTDCAACSAGEPCENCLAGDAGGLLHHNQQVMVQQPGPQVGTVSYPYYTFHGPRDFLAGNPPSLGR